MSKKFLYPLLFVVIYLVSLFAMLPANYVVKHLSLYAPQVTVKGISGTIWSGDIQYLQTNDIVLENLSWQLSPLSLLWGTAAIELFSVSAQQSIEGELKVALWGEEISLNHLRIRFPVSQYAQQMQISDYGLSGQFELQVEHLNYQLGVIESAKGALIWHQAGMTNSLQLGDLMLGWQLLEGEVDAELSDLSGPIDLDGTISLSHTGQYKANALLEVKDNSDVNLKQALRLLGKSVGENRIQFEKQGQLVMPPALRLQ